MNTPTDARGRNVASLARRGGRGLLGLLAGPQRLFLVRFQAQFGHSSLQVYETA